MPFATGKRGSSSALPSCSSSLRVPICILAGAASRDLLEVSELDLECDRAPANTGALAVPPDLVDDLTQRITRGFVGDEIGGKRRHFVAPTPVRIIVFRLAWQH
jgi:hypothetical protein